MSWRTFADSFRHIRRLTDDTGILEHALGRIPRRKEGYSTDDQARALWLCLEWLPWVRGEEARALHRLIDTYLSFLLWVQKEDGHFHNNIAYDRSKESEKPSDDCLGRGLWAAALSLTVLKDRERRLAAQEIFDKALPQAAGMRSPRGWAYALSAVSLLARSGYPRDLAAEINLLAGRLMEVYDSHASADWRWYEPTVAYGNGVLPWGLLNGYEMKRDRRMLDTALESLDFLIRLSVNERGQIRPVGNRGWCVPGRRALWDQQPLDVMKLALAVSKAFELTGRKGYAEVAKRCLAWFHGDNDGGTALADPDEGSCCDGLGQYGANRNQGAEATISYLLTEAICRKLAEARKHPHT
jgi:hypothetical protein